MRQGDGRNSHVLPGYGYEPIAHLPPAAPLQIICPYMWYAPPMGPRPSTQRPLAHGLHHIDREETVSLYGTWLGPLLTGRELGRGVPWRWAFTVRTPLGSPRRCGQPMVICGNPLELPRKAQGPTRSSLRRAGEGDLRIDLAILPDHLPKEGENLPWHVLSVPVSVGGAELGTIGDQAGFPFPSRPTGHIPARGPLVDAALGGVTDVRPRRQSSHPVGVSLGGTLWVAPTGDGSADGTASTAGRHRGAREGENPLATRPWRSSPGPE